VVHVSNATRVPFQVLATAKTVSWRLTTSHDVSILYYLSGEK